MSFPPSYRTSAKMHRSGVLFAPEDRLQAIRHMQETTPKSSLIPMLQADQLSLCRRWPPLNIVNDDTGKATRYHRGCDDESPSINRIGQRFWRVNPVLLRKALQRYQRERSYTDSPRNDIVQAFFLSLWESFQPDLRHIDDIPLDVSPHKRRMV